MIWQMFHTACTSWPNLGLSLPPQNDETDHQAIAARTKLIHMLIKTIWCAHKYITHVIQIQVYTSSGFPSPNTPCQLNKKKMHHHAIMPAPPAPFSLAKFWSGIKVPDRLPRRRRVVAVARILLPGRLPTQKAQQDTCNESWMVDFPLSTLICDADEPKARLPAAPLTPPSSFKSTPPKPLDGFIKEKKKKERSSLDFKGLTFQNGPGVALEGVGWWNNDVNCNAKQKG